MCEVRCLSGVDVFIVPTEGGNLSSKKMGIVLDIDT